MCYSSCFNVYLPVISTITNWFEFLWLAWHPPSRDHWFTCQSGISITASRKIRKLLLGERFFWGLIKSEISTTTSLKNRKLLMCKSLFWGVINCATFMSALLSSSMKRGKVSLLAHAKKHLTVMRMIMMWWWWWCWGRGGWWWEWCCREAPARGRTGENWGDGVHLDRIIWIQFFHRSY